MNRSALRSMVVALFLALLIVPAWLVGQEPGNRAGDQGAHARAQGYGDGALGLGD